MVSNQGDADDATVFGGLEPLLRYVSLVDVGSVKNDVQMRMPVVGRFVPLDLQEGDTSFLGFLPEGLSSQAAEGVQQVVKLVGEWDVAVLDGQC